MRATVDERGQRRCLFPSLHDLLDGLNNGSETSSSAMKDLQSKLDTVSAECLTEKEKVINPFCFKLSPSYNC